MEISLLKELFSDDELEIELKSLNDVIEKEDQVDDALKRLEKTFENSEFKIYFIRRLGKGLVHSIPALEINKNNGESEFHALRYFEKNEVEYRSSKYFDRAIYHVRRMKNLKKLKDHYPKIHILDLENGALILQEFLFYPICKFKDKKSIEQLFNLIFLACQNKIFLDFNHNHWLYNKAEGQLYYVDKDYNEDLKTIKDSTIQNFNQASIFLNDKNPPYFAQVLNSLMQSNDSIKKRNFSIIILDLIKEKIEILKKREQSKIVVKRLTIYERMLKLIKN